MRSPPLTLMHDRHLLMTETSNHRLNLTTAESSNWYQAVSLFNNRLSLLPRWHAEECPGSSQIALLSTAAILWTVAFCHIEARSPEEAWPLNSTSSDLNWLHMNNGKEQIWKLTQSYPPDPMSMALSSIHNHELLPTLPGAVDAVLNILPPEYIRVFNLDIPDTPPSTGTRDPYYGIGVQVAQIVYMNVPIHVTVLRFISFLSGMSPEVKGLLQAKDPRVLLALVLCYAKLYHVDVWWLSRRLLLEGQAICIYLDLLFSHYVNIQTLLQFPKMIFHI